MYVCNFFDIFVKREKKTMSYKVKHIMKYPVIKKKDNDSEAGPHFRKKIVNNLGLPGFFIIFHN